MHSYQCHRYHLVFSTKSRLPFIAKEIEEDIWQYIIGLGKQSGIRMYAIGVVDDHIHMLVGIPAAKAVADAVQELKGPSSRWMKQQFSNAGMGWQTGYGSFTTMASAVDKTVQYIRNQRVHHQFESFEQEMDRIKAMHDHGEKYLL